VNSGENAESARLATRSPRGNIASTTITGHRHTMRRYIAISVSLLLAACATAPRQESVAPAPAVPQQPADQNSLLGLTAQQLYGRFGAPALQIHEGNSLKLQFRTARCVIDAYLYPSANGGMKVTYVDTRLPSGADVSQAACIAPPAAS
jgi:hypothetical protein